MPPAATARFSRARATRTSFALASARNRCSGERPNAAGAGAPLTLTRRRLYEEPRLRAEARRRDGKGLFRTPGSVHAAAREYLFLVHAPFFVSRARANTKSRRTSQPSAWQDALDLTAPS
jgi:hypothetical protein